VRDQIFFHKKIRFHQKNHLIIGLSKKCIFGLKPAQHQPHAFTNNNTG